MLSNLVLATIESLGNHRTSRPVCHGNTVAAGGLEGHFDLAGGREMNSRVISALPIFLSFLLSGCMGIGGFWMTGDPSAGKDIKPALHYWEKGGMTVEGRRADWVECGGRLDGGYTPDARLPGETDDFAAARRKQQRLGACMETKGYRFSRNSAK